jgi:hypothetical protein
MAFLPGLPLQVFPRNFPVESVWRRTLPKPIFQNNLVIKPRLSKVDRREANAQ